MALSLIYNNVSNSLLSIAKEYVDSGVPVNNAWRGNYQYFSTENDEHSLLEGLAQKYKEIITDGMGSVKELMI